MNKHQLCSYAAAARNGNPEAPLGACTAAASVAADLDLKVNIHDLNLANLLPLMSRMPVVSEASIGHELTADALVMGLSAAVAAEPGPFKEAVWTHPPT
jgi:pyridoxine 5-phosphate synthase